MSREPNNSLMARVERAVATVLERDGHLTYPLILCELGALTKEDFEAWRAGRVPYLEKVIRTNLTKLARIQTAVRRIARARGLKRTVTGPKRGQRYSKTGHPFVEEEYAAWYRPIQPGSPATEYPRDRHAIPRILGGGGPDDS